MIGILEKHHFLLRRLHSLTGIVPIGIFLIAHLTTNSSILWGRFALRSVEAPEGGILAGGVLYFVKEVIWINEQIPHLLLIEIALWGSLAFHSVLGVYYATTGKRNTERYAYQDNWRYSLQRWTGYIGLVYVFYHVATLRWGWTFIVPGGTQWSHNFSASTLAAAMKGSYEGFTIGGIVVSLLYFAGVTALVYHFANGLWTAAITWGVTITAQAQKRWGQVCLILGVGLMGAGWASVIGFLAVDTTTAFKIERAKYVDKYGEEALQEYLESKGLVDLPKSELESVEGSGVRIESAPGDEAN